MYRLSLLFLPGEHVSQSPQTPGKKTIIQIFYSFINRQNFAPKTHQNAWTSKLLHIVKIYVNNDPHKRPNQNPWTDTAYQILQEKNPKFRCFAAKDSEQVIKLQVINMERGILDHVTKNARPLQSKDLNQAIYAPTTNYKIDMSTYLSQATERRPKLGKNVQFDNIAFVMFHNTLPGKCNPVNWSSKAAIHIMQVVLKHLWVLNSLT